MKCSQVKKILYAGLLAFVVTLPAVITSPYIARAEEVSDYAQKAKFDAEKARADAEKAMAEAEKAIAEADRAISEAESLKAKAKKEKAEALEKMVSSGHIPQDISMTTPESKTIAVFSHKKHTDREKLKCIECHPKVFIMKVGSNVVKKGQLTMAEMSKGKYCGNCHNDDKAFSVTSVQHCKKCHPAN